VQRVRPRGPRLLHRLWKPWFVYQPTWLARRVAAAVLPPSSGYTPLQTSWGVRIIADPTRTIGRSIITTGIYDLAVSEALTRLISPGDTVVDAGANVGYMTVLAGVAAGAAGRVLSFEPHPGLFGILQQNATAIRKQLNIARIELHQTALGDQPGTAELQLPPDFDSNDGVARIGRAEPPGWNSVTVQLETLDSVLGTDSVSVLKLDVEGAELQVLRGLSVALTARRVRHIVFEDHAIGGSDVARELRRAGYQLFSLGWSMRGPIARPLETGSLATKYEAPSFIATLAPNEVLARFQPKGWAVLSRRLVNRYARPR
jgi:FkbM family methyltransferase